METRCRYDRTEVRHLLDVRRAEGLTYEQLSKRSGVPVHVLSYRAAQDRRERQESEVTTTSFAEVVRASGPETCKNASGIELILPCGLRALLDREFDEDALTRLLAVAQC